ncbi:hypothetical protein V2J09_007951 [Rumex salicifolius]
MSNLPALNQERKEMAVRPREWVKPDEAAAEMFSRVLQERPPLLLPPLHRLPLYPGDVLEIAGASPSAKSQILMQAAINCILPKEWKDVQYGGLERAVMYFDLDCRFDILRLSQLLRSRIRDAKGSKIGNDDNNELIQMCLKRFLYIRCYDSFGFLATLKTLQNKLQSVRTELGVSVHLLMIDSIGAFYWVDRASTSLPLGPRNRKMISLQSVTEAVVREIKLSLVFQPMVVLATKASIFADKSETNDARRTSRIFSSQDAIVHSTTHREYMPSIWQSFVKYRVFVHGSNSEASAVSVTDGHVKEKIFVTEWLVPSLGFTDKFVVRDVRIIQIKNF